MANYPVNLNLVGRKCAVIGGGNIAFRKTLSLLEAKAFVTVISPALNNEMTQLERKGLLEHKSKAYSKGDAQGFFLVICASDNMEANQQAAMEAKANGALVNSADDSFPSDFTLPAKVRRGPLLLTVSTGGLSPAFSVLVKKELEEKYNDDYVAFLQIVADLRVQLKEILATSKEREQVWRTLLTEEILQLVQKGNLSEAKVKLEHAISSFGSQS